MSFWFIVIGAVVLFIFLFKGTVKDEREITQGLRDENEKNTVKDGSP